ncbi:hypothetical protein [Fluviicola sp.]|uniref:hypothetical protein n=1 Tax=Fluviicola sp. TaxID=1917219 RepID=UPI0031D2D633
MGTVKIKIIELKSVLVRLIADELKIAKIADDLMKEGRDVGHFQFSIGSAVFFLTGTIHLDGDIDLLEWYVRQIERNFDIPFENEDQRHDVAEKILLGLVQWKAPEVEFRTDL